MKRTEKPDRISGSDCLINLVQVFLIAGTDYEGPPGSGQIAMTASSEKSQPKSQPKRWQILAVVILCVWAVIIYRLQFAYSYSITCAATHYEVREVVPNSHDPLPRINAR